MSENAVNEAVDSGVVQARLAFERLSSEIAAVPDSALIRVNLDVTSMVGTVLAKVPGLRALRPQIEKELPLFDLAQFGKLEALALALFYAHGAYLVATQPPRSLEELGNQATTLRKILFGDASAQAARGVFDEARLGELREGAGYRDLAADLIALVNLYRGRWQEVEKTTGITAADLERADTLAAQLVIAVGERDVPVARDAAIDQRERAFALLLAAYNDARRAVLYLRAKTGDADILAPSLYAGRRGRPETESMSEPSPSPTESGAIPAVPAPAPEATSEAIPRIKVGLPGAKAFTE